MKTSNESLQNVPKFERWGRAPTNKNFIPECVLLFSSESFVSPVCYLQRKDEKTKNNIFACCFGCTGV
jgi:hypothetical protein